VTLTGNSIHNDNGLIKGNTATVTANDEVRNTQGTIMGNDTVSVYAKKDVVNEGGTITQTNAAGSTKVSAGRDVINKGVQYEAGNSKVEWNSSNNRRETITGVDQGRIGGAGQTTVVAGRDVSMEAGIISSDVNTKVTAGRNVTMKAMNATHELEEHRFDKGKSGGGHSQTTESHDLVKAQSSVGSSIEGKNVSVLASDAVQLEGSQLLAADTVQVSGNTIALNTAKADSTVNHVYLDKKKSLVKRESTNAVDDVTTTSVTGSILSGKTVTITSAHDVTGQSAQIMGENAVSVTVGGKVELGADKSTTDGSSVYRHKKSGLLGGAGIGFTIGKEKHNIDEANHEESTVRNTIASTKGAVTIKANDTVHITSADIVAKEGAVLDGSAVKLDGNVDHNHMTYDERYKKSGLTVSLGGAVANTLTNATRTIKQAGGRDDKRLAGLELNEARKQLQDGYEAVDAALHGEKIRDAVTGKVDKVDGKAKRGAKNIDDAINLSVSIGSTSRKQGQVVDTNTYQGGTLISDGNIQIIARDAQQSGVGLTGETIQAKKLVLDSASNVNLEAGKNTVDAHNTYKSSGWSVGAGVSLTGGGLLDINASGHMARQNGDTHQETYVPTKIKAAELAQLKAKRDTNIIGSTVAGKKVEVDTGRDLHIQSLQDVDNFKEHSKSAGFSVSSKPTFKDFVGSIGGSVGRIDSKWKSVTKQAGIQAGDEGYIINTGNKTKLKGAVISSKAEKNKNILSTKNLIMEDITNEAEYSVRENGVQYNRFGDIKSKSKHDLDKIYKELGVTPTGGLGAHDKSNSTTQSAVSEGIIKENGRMVDVKRINTDIEHSLNTLQSIFDRKSIEEKQELANLFSINANEAIHQIAKHEGWNDGDPRKVALHTLFGGATASLGGSNFAEGAYIGGLTEAMMPELEKWAGTITGPDGKQYVNSERLQQIAYIFGYATNKSLGQNGQSGAYVARMGAKYNQGSELSEFIEEKVQLINRRLFEPKGDGPSYQSPDRPVDNTLTINERADILGGNEGYYSKEEVEQAHKDQDAYQAEINETVQAALERNRARNEDQYTEPYTPPIETEQVVGGESEATQAYNVSMSEINNPTDVSKKDVNRAIAVTGGVSSTWLVGGGLHHEGERLTNKVISTDKALKLGTILGKSASKAVAMEVGGLAGDATFTAINMNQNRIDFEGRPDLIEKADELDKTSLAIGATGSAITLGSGALYAPAGVVVGVGFVAGNTIYSFNAELEKDKLREEYKLWKTGGK
ncbi:hemagglutinin repeat-containing protein, partial [Veillonella sp.]|uniref:hemagglutinin repeat-containing protein n=1 Tax=Veillonella sp. TaxID=1926307 RepID=UPI002913642F